MMSSTPTSTHPPQMLNPYFYRRLREMKENQFQQFPISNPLLLAVLLPISAPYAAASALHPHFVGGGQVMGFRGLTRCIRYLFLSIQMVLLATHMHCVLFCSALFCCVKMSCWDRIEAPFFAFASPELNGYGNSMTVSSPLPPPVYLPCTWCVLCSSMEKCACMEVVGKAAQLPPNQPIHGFNANQ